MLERTTTDTTDLAGSTDPTLRPAPPRRAVVPRPSEVDAIGRLLQELPWHPYVWAYRAVFAAAAGLFGSSLLVLSAPTWSAEAAIALHELDALNGVPLPIALLALSTVAVFVGLAALRGAVRLGRTYPPLHAEIVRARRNRPTATAGRAQERSPLPAPPRPVTEAPSSPKRPWGYEITA
ncbi:MAG: hypothetical protein ACI8PZ_004175 [Myxococcota bacterium]|jgi:hypothetical protein